MAIKIEYIREFIMLAEKLNITETAVELYITQPALSKHLSFIEENLGVQLFNRTTHTMELTEEGQIVYKDFKKIVSDYDLLISKMSTLKNGIIGNLNIGIMYYAVKEYIDPLVTLFQEKHNNINLSIKSCQPHQIIKYLSEDIIDIGMVIKFKSIPNKKFNIYPLKKEKSMVITLLDHPFAKKSSVKLSDIAQQDMILLRMEKEYSENVTYLLKKNKALPKNIVYAEQIDLLPLVLEKTNGMFIGQDLLRNMPRKDLVFTEIDSDVFDFDMCFACSKKNSNPSIQLLLRTWEDLNNKKRSLELYD